MSDARFDPMHQAQVERNKLHNEVCRLNDEIALRREELRALEARKSALDAVVHMIDKGLAAMTEAR